ncbi:hypothetical protein LJ142_002029 [Salmonella enterica]|nr:hypothetical protein [Salmonella enterica]
MAVFILPEHQITLDAHFHIPVIQAIALRAAVTFFTPFICGKKNVYALWRPLSNTIIYGPQQPQSLNLNRALSFSLPDYFQMLKIILW